MTYKGYQLEILNTKNGYRECRIKGTDVVFTSKSDIISSFHQAVDSMSINTKPQKKVYSKVKKSIITPMAEYEMEENKEEEE